MFYSVYFFAPNQIRIPLKLTSPHFTIPNVNKLHVSLEKLSKTNYLIKSNPMLIYSEDTQKYLTPR